MTSIVDVQDLSPRAQYTASGGQTVFPYPFPIFEDDNLVVYDNDTLQVLTTNYTVSGAGNDTGGNVTFTSGRTAGHVITIYRDIPIERTSDFQTNGPFASASMNDELDRITLVLQQLESAIGRSLRIPKTTAVADSAIELSPIANWLSRFVFIGANGTPEPATSVTTNPLSQSIIAQLLNPQTSAEASAGASPTHYEYDARPIIALERYLTPHATNDNTAGLLAALAHADALGGAIVQAPAGTIRYDGAITMPRYVTLRGVGWSTVFKPLSSSGVINLVGGNNVFEDIFFEGSVVTPGSYVGTCFLIGPTDFSGHHTFRRVYIRRFQIGVRSRAALWTRFEQSRIEFNRVGIDFDSLSGTHQNNAIAIVDSLIAFNERQGIATSNSPIANRGLLIQGGSIEGNGDADYTLYEQCQLNRFADVKISTYFESLSANKPDALTLDNCGSVEIVSCSFIGARTAIRDKTGGTTGRIYVARNTGSGIVTRGVDLANGTDNEVERSNSWTGAASANIVTGTRSRDYTNRKAEFLNQQTAFTPTLVGTGVAGTPTYSIQTAYYSRIDNLIFVQGRVSVTALGGMTGLVSVRGLPFTSVNNSHGHGLINVQIDGCTVSGGNTQFSGQIPPNTAQIDLVQEGSTATAQINATALAAATTVIFSGWYVAA